MSKSDQTGDRAFAKHTFANPITPATCIVLSLAIHILCCSYFKNGDYKIFPQETISLTFSQWLKHTADSLSEAEQTILGISSQDLGTHSIRKGACIYASGQQCSPSAIAIKLRMGHSLGETSDRYYFESDGADQLLGRFLSGLCFTRPEFGTLPPHYKSVEFERNIDWSAIVLYYNQYPSCFKTAIPYLIASVVYHLDYLRTTLPPAFEIIDFGNKNKIRLSDIAYATAHKKLKQRKRAAHANVNEDINEDVNEI